MTYVRYADRYISLDVFSTTAYRVYPVLFANERVALAWMSEHDWSKGATTYVTSETMPDDGEPWGDSDEIRHVDPDLDPELYDRFYGDCEHGLSRQLCAGPMHYPDDRYDY